MNFDKKKWNQDLKNLRNIIKKEDTFNKSKELFFDIYKSVHESLKLDINNMTYEDELWNGMDEKIFKKSINKNGRTIAYGIWHSTRIEDITMNLLVAEDRQIIDCYNFKERVNSPIYNTGNQLTSKEILEISEKIDMYELREYRKKVFEKSIEIVKDIKYLDLKKKVSKEGIDKILLLGAVSQNKEAIWLIDFWRKKTVAGILLMPCLRHNMVHLNESFEAKKRKKK